MDEAEDLTPVYEDAGRRYGVDPALLQAQTHVESNDNDFAVSDAGAEGRSQFLPSTAARMGLRNPYDPREAIPMQAKLLRENMDRFGRPDMAIAAYHGGSDPASWGPRTRDYLNKVAQAYSQRQAAPPPAKEADDWVTPSAPQADADDWITPGQPARPLQFNKDHEEEGRPLTNRQAVKQLPPAQVDEGAQSPPPAAHQPGYLERDLQERHEQAQAVWGAIKQGWQATPEMLTPLALDWADQHGLGTVARAGGAAGRGIFAAFNAAFNGVSEEANQLGISMGMPWLGNAMQSYIETAGMHGGPGIGEALHLPHEPVARAGAQKPVEAPAETPAPEGRPEAPAGATPEAPGSAAPVEGEAPPRTWEQEALDELDPETTRAAEAGNADLERIAGEEGVKLPAWQKPGLREREQFGPVAPPPEPEAAPTETTKDLPEPPGAEKPEPEVAQPPSVRERLAEVSEREAEISKAEEQEPPVQRETLPPPAPPPRRQAGPSPYEKLPREPTRLVEWLRQNGGIQDTGGDLKAIIGGARGRPGLINNKSGATLDDAALAAWQAGYLPDASRPDTNALLDAIRDDHTAATTGTKRYSQQDYDRVQEYQAAVERNDEVDRLAAEHEIETKGKTRDQFYDELYDRLSTGERAREIADQEAAFLDAQQEFERESEQWIAYHGTPNDNFDQFDLAHIGSGEGNQAYGRGFYAAENPSVGDGYAKSTVSGKIMVDGKPIPDDASPEYRHIAGLIAERGLTPADRRQAALDLQAVTKRRDEMLNTAYGARDEAQRWVERAQRTLDAIDDLAKRNVTRPKGHVLQVRLHAKPEEMIDYDKTLAEQPPAVRAALEDVYRSLEDWQQSEVLGSPGGSTLSGGVLGELEGNGGDLGDLPAGPFLSAIEEASGEKISDIPARLRAAGVKGVRYLDAGSRNAGEGTRNVVMFDPRDIEITHRNGKPVAPEAWNARDFYGQSQARSLEDLENEYRAEASASEAQQRGQGAERPEQAAPPEGAGEEAEGPRGRAAGDTGRSEAERPAPGSDLLGRPVGKQSAVAREYAAADQAVRDAFPAWQAAQDAYRSRKIGDQEFLAARADYDKVMVRFDKAYEAMQNEPEAAPAKRQPEPTIKNDTRQDVMPGMGPSAVQAQAARDAQGRGALQSDVAQKPADEGLFAPDTSGQTELYSFPGMLFSPAAWRRLFQQRAATGGYDILRDKQGISRWMAEFKAGLAPTSLRGAKGMEYAIRRHTGESAQAFDIAANKLDLVRGELDKLPIAAQVDFTDRMERGQRQPTPELQQVADTIRGVLDEWKAKVQGLGRGYLANAIENYMGHIWGNYREWSQGLLGGPQQQTQAQMQAAATGRNVSKRPLRGSGAFLKQRTFPTQREGIDAGLVPVTYNPIDLQLIKIHEMQKFYHGTKLADQIKQTSMARWIPDRDVRNAAREGLVELNDGVFQPRLYGVSGAGPVEPGKWMAPEPLARIFNNYMSQGWHGQSAIYDGLRRMNNGLNSLQLGLSGFHAMFVLNDAATSKMALGVQQISRGDLGRGVGNVLFGTAAYPGAVAQTVRKGAEFRRAWLDPAGASPEMRRIVDAAKAGGFRMSMPDFFRSSAAGPFFRHLRDLKTPQGAYYQALQMFKDAPTLYQKAIATPVRIAFRALDSIQEPLMGALVPRAKAGVFYDLAADWLRRNPAASPEELSAAMTQFQDSVDNRLGQFNYDNGFWNKTAKDIAFITTRSVGWNLGTLRELGGAVVDGGSFLKDIGNGRWPKITTRMAYALAMPVVTAELGAILTYLGTGRAAQGWDYFYPPTGTQDAAGNEERRNIPGYMKDVIGFWHAPTETFINKQSPMLSALSEVFVTGKDYYGGSIYDPQHDSGPVQAYADFLINEAMPFSVQALRRSQAAEGGRPALDQALDFAGFQQAPKYITAPMRGERFQHREAQKAFKARVKETQRGQRFNVFNQVSP